jgi:hypothetical protein
MKRSLLLAMSLACASLQADDEVAAFAKKETRGTMCAAKPQVVDPCFMRGDDPLTGMPGTISMQPSYNYPANISSSNGWDVFGTVSYLYWYAKQDGMDLAPTGYLYSEDIWEPANVGGTVIRQHTKYTSGFKVGLGANLDVDDWVVNLTYTYLRQNTHTTAGDLPDTLSSTGLPSIYNLSGWFQNNYYGGQTVADTFKSKWKMHLDWLDLQFSRPCYQGRRLIVTPSAGLRASWIRQQLHIASPNVRNVYEFVTPVEATSNNYSASWAIGPRGLIDMRYLVGGGFRFQGNFGGSLLFTQYTHISHRESTLSDGPTSFSGGVQVSSRNDNYLRAMAEADLGIGWGTYFCDNEYHIDFSATYDFNYLWGQNMMRHLISESNAFVTGVSGDLMLHGLELNARFDF